MITVRQYYLQMFSILLKFYIYLYEAKDLRIYYYWMQGSSVVVFSSESEI